MNRIRTYLGPAQDAELMAAVRALLDSTCDYYMYGDNDEGEAVVAAGPYDALQALFKKRCGDLLGITRENAHNRGNANDDDDEEEDDDVDDDEEGDDFGYDDDDEFDEGDDDEDDDYLDDDVGEEEGEV